MEKQKVTVFEVEVQEASVKIGLLNDEQTEVLELTLYKQTYENGEWIDDQEVTEKYFTALQDVFGIMDDSELEDDLMDKEVELFVDEEKGKAYIEEPKSLDLVKPELDNVGDIETGEIVEVIDFDTKRIIVIDVDGKRFGVNFGYGKFHPKLEKYLVSKVDEIKKHQKFKDLTGHEWDDKDSIIGKTAMLEIKSFKIGKTERAFVEMKKLKK